MPMPWMYYDFTLLPFIGHNMLYPRVFPAKIIFEEARKSLISAKLLYRNPVHLLLHPVGGAVAVKLLRSPWLHNKIEADFMAVQALQSSFVLIKKVLMDNRNHTSSLVPHR